VITELVLNHTSDQHAWFQRSRRAAPGPLHLRQTNSDRTVHGLLRRDPFPRIARKAPADMRTDKQRPDNGQCIQPRRRVRLMNFDKQIR
jgi:glycosidase